MQTETSQIETKKCPRCWEISPKQAMYCIACRHEFAPEQPRPRPQEALRKTERRRFWPFAQRRA